jgi:hypothetical protein
MRSARVLSGVLFVSAVAAVAPGCGSAGEGKGAKAVAAPTNAASTAVGCSRLRPGTGPTRTRLNSREGSAIALAKLGETTIAYVADPDVNGVRTFDLTARRELALTQLSGEPAQVLVLADGRVAVSLRDTNEVSILEPSASLDGSLEQRCTQTLPSEPFGLAATPDDTALLVTSAWARKVTVLDAATLASKYSVDVPREPRAIVVDDDGQRAFVAHVVGGTMSVVDLHDKHDVRQVDLRVKKLGDAKTRGGCQGFALAKSVETDKPAPGVVDAPSGEKPSVKLNVPKDVPANVAPRGRVFAPMVTVDSGELTQRSSGYGSTADLVAAESPMVSVIDAAAERAMTKTLMHDGKRHVAECILPRAAAASPSGSLFVTCMGTDSVVELDARGLDPARLEHRRWNVPGGPTGIAIDDDASHAMVWSQFDHAVAILPLDHPDDATLIASAERGRSKLTPTAAIGRRLFHHTDDARVASDGRACASCHPDGREDALSWSTPDGPRQTIMLAGRVQASSPFGWNGAHADIKIHLSQTFKRLGGRGINDDQTLDALIEYVNSMRGPTPDAPPAAEDKRALIARGQDLFFDEQRGCAGCHVGGSGTDQATHDVGSALKIDRSQPFDTPSLRFISGTAPYFHDGRFATLDEVLTASDGKMGHTLELSRHDALALKAYMETL